MAERRNDEMIGTRSGDGKVPGRACRRGRPYRGAARSRVDRADWVVAEVLHELYDDAVLGFVMQRITRREEAERITAEVFAAAAEIGRASCRERVWIAG